MGYRADPANAVRHLLCCARRAPTPGPRGSGRAAQQPSAPSSTSSAAGAGEERAAEALPLVGYVTSCLHVPLAKLDCGTGAPRALSYSTLPFRSANGLLFGSLAPGPDGDGVLLLLAARAAEAEALRGEGGEAGRALRELVPGARVLLPPQEASPPGGTPAAAAPVSAAASAAAATSEAAAATPAGRR